jgi:hypothetical protein
VQHIKNHTVTWATAHMQRISVARSAAAADIFACFASQNTWARIRAHCSQQDNDAVPSHPCAWSAGGLVNTASCCTRLALAAWCWACAGLGSVVTGSIIAGAASVCCWCGLRKRCFKWQNSSNRQTVFSNPVGPLKGQARPPSADVVCRR